MAYKMTHPASDLEIKVDADSVPMYESQGWTTTPATEKPPAEDADEK